MYTMLLLHFSYSWILFIYFRIIFFELRKYEIIANMNIEKSSKTSPFKSPPFNFHSARDPPPTCAIRGRQSRQ